MVRVLVVEDSLTVRRHLCELLAGAADIELVGEAGDGKRAIELCRELRPDVVTMDMIMPEMSGLAATEQIMAFCPTPILIVSSSTNRGELFQTYQALSAGAVDVLEKPRGDDSDGAWAQRFLAALRLVSKIRVITHPRGRLTPAGRAMAESRAMAEGRAIAESRVPPSPPPVAVAPSRHQRLVAIGVSTGGPGALTTLLSALPADFALPILLVLHIGRPFGASIADWLDGQSRLRVATAVHGEPLANAAGRVVIAPPDRHLTIRDGRICLSDESPRHSCRPSVDVLFESVAKEAGPGAIACLLTGMGRDGAAGLLAIRKAGGQTIAQDEATSVVYGMPREAVLLGAAERVLPLGEIGHAIATLAATSRGVGR